MCTVHACTRTLTHTWTHGEKEEEEEMEEERANSLILQNHNIEAIFESHCIKNDPPLHITEWKFKTRRILAHR